MDTDPTPNGDSTVDPRFNFLLPQGAKPQQSPPAGPPPQALPPVPSGPPSLGRLPVSNNVLEIPQQFNPFAARPELIDSIMHQESGGDPSAAGKKGEVGLMQIMPTTAAQYGVTPQQLLDPEVNRQVGTRYFSDLLKQYRGNEFLALVAYNEGPGRVSKGQFLPQSVAYATSVLKRAGDRLPSGGPQGGQAQMQFPPGFGGQQGQPPPQQMAGGPPPGGPQSTLEIPQQRGLGGGQPQLQIPSGMGPMPPPSQMGAVQAPPPQAAAQSQSLQQILAGQGPEEKYGALGAQPFAAMQAGQPFRPQEVANISNIASGSVGAIGSEEDIAQLSKRARAMVRSAAKFGLDPESVATLARRNRLGALSDDQLSLALKDLKGRIPKATAIIRQYADRLPRDLLGQVSQAIRTGAITEKQAKAMLKAGVGGVAGATLLNQFLGSGQPTTQQSGTPQQPGLMSQIGGGLSNLLGEGTAYAEEPPPAPGAGGPPPAAAPPAAAAPSGPAGLPPVPQGLPPVPQGAPPPVASGPGGGSQLPGAPTGGLPQGMSVGISGGRPSFKMGPEETTGEATKEEALRRQGTQVYNLLGEMQSLYQNKILPKLQSGEIGSMGEAFIYSEPGYARNFGYEIDPDVHDWIVKSGQLALGMNAYYSAQSGGRGGISLLEQGTDPHVPHPPGGLREVFGIWSPSGQQWDLQQQGEGIPTLMHNIQRDLGGAQPEQYTPYQAQPQQPAQAATPAATPTSDWIRLPSGKMHNLTTGETR